MSGLGRTRDPLKDPFSFTSDSGVSELGCVQAGPKEWAGDVSALDRTPNKSPMGVRFYSSDLLFREATTGT